MKSILKDLYYGELSPHEEQPPANQTKHDRDVDEKILEVLGDNTNLLDEVIGNYSESQEKLHFYNFKQGFTMGVKLMLEVMRD